MSQLPVTVIVTVLNEKKSVLILLDALDKQSMQPQKVIIVDGGSKSDIWLYLLGLQQRQWAFELQMVQKQGNRSVGRNHAIHLAATELIAITDAGCVPEHEWLEALVEQHRETHSTVVAGYYRGLATNAFQEAMIPYALVMPDKVNPEHFLPATRSMLLAKSVWEKYGGFDESLADNEDYAFACTLQENRVPIAFAGDAIVLWQPRTSLWSFAIMIFRFARGDAFAGILRPKVVFLFGRYLIVVAALMALSAIGQSHLAVWILQGGLAMYLLWTVIKNYRYCRQSWYWLPVLQITADFMVMMGSVAGWWRRLFGKNVIKK